MYRGGGGGCMGKGLEMITINQELAGVIPDYIGEQEMESRWQGLPSLFRKLIWILWRVEAMPPLIAHLSGLFSVIQRSQNEHNPNLCLLLRGTRTAEH